MAGIEKRKVKAGDVRLEVTLKKNKYDLFIEFGADADISKPIEGKGYYVRMWFTDSRRTPEEVMQFEKRNKQYKYSKSRKSLVTSDYVIKTAEYTLVVLLEPEFYAPKERIAQVIQKTKKKNYQERNLK